MHHFLIFHIFQDTNTLLNFQFPTFLDARFCTSALSSAALLMATNCPTTAAHKERCLKDKIRF